MPTALKNIFDPLRSLFDPLFNLLGSLLTTFHTTFGAPWWLSIVMLTICVRAVLLPLTIRQTRSMRAMQNLRPEMDALNKKYKSDPQRRQQELMKLYQERKVNPLGGCLPVVVQLPIFLVLYYTIREFEKLPSFHTGGLLWFPDLTASDPYFILPILYIGTMMAAQEVTLRNSPMQGQQQMIMRFLPVAFGFFLARFPAGLLVYWIASNIISFLQNLLIYRYYPVTTPATATAGAGSQPQEGLYGTLMNFLSPPQDDRKPEETKPSAASNANGKETVKAGSGASAPRGQSTPKSSAAKRRRRKKSKKK